MGKGTIRCKSYKAERGYYLDKDYSEKVGGEFYFLLLPLSGNINEQFFYVKDNFDGSFTVEGECYIITDEKVLNRYIRNARKELKGKPIWYYHIDGDCKILKREKVNL